MQTVLKHTVEYRLGVPELTLTSDAHDTRYIRSRAHGSSLQTTREKERERERVVPAAWSALKLRQVK
jgi:hypothetical protein